MMNRREMLVSMFGAAVAATVAPLINLGDATPAFWNQAPLKELLPWRIMFPDGQTFTFAGEVVSEMLTSFGPGEILESTLTVRPTGPVTITKEAPSLGTEVHIATATLVHPEGSSMRLRSVEIASPEIEYIDVETREGWVKELRGLKHHGMFTLKGTFNGD